jgi:hypothetical protein
MQGEKVQRVLVCDAQKKPVGVISLQDLAQSGTEKDVGATVREVNGIRGHNTEFDRGALRPPNSVLCP